MAWYKSQASNHSAGIIVRFFWEAPGGPVVRTWHFHCPGPGSSPGQETKILQECVLVAQSCTPLCDPLDCYPTVYSVHGILHARILEWVAIPFSRRSLPPRDWTPVGHLHCRQILYHLSHQGSPKACGQKERKKKRRFFQLRRKLAFILAN